MRTIDRIMLACAHLVYKLFNGALALFRFLFFGSSKIPQGIKKIVIYRLSNIGDIICAMPAMVAVRENFPDAKIILLTSPGKKGLPEARDMLEGNSFLDNIITYYQEDIRTLKGRINLIKSLRKEGCDLFVELRQDLVKFPVLLRDMLFARLIGCKYALGFRIDTVKLFRQVQSKCLSFDNEVVRLLNILKREGLIVKGVRFPFCIPDEDKRKVGGFLEQYPGELVAFCPNAKRQANQWPLERFAQVAKFLIREKKITVFILGSRSDKERTQRLEALIGAGAVSVAGIFNILQTVELLKHCRFLLSNDTGAVHMASSVNTPVVGIYTAWQLKGKWYPYGDNNVILRKEPRCHTCYRHNCRSVVCLDMVSAEEVCSAAFRMLS